MDKLISAFPQNMIDALAIAENMNFKKPSTEIKNVVICGMGGSGIGGKIVSEWIMDTASCPVFILNDYSLPEFVGPDSLVIGSSYSGNTEETLAGIYSAHAKGAHIIGICSGGDLKAFCEKNDYDCVVVPGGNPPRTQLAFSVVQLTSVFVKLGLAPEKLIDEIRSAHDLLVSESGSIHEKAQLLADHLYSKVGVIYCGPKYEGVAIRARQQFNENSKLLCWHHIIPEMNHNELVGWGGGDDRFAVVFLKTDDIDPRNKRRYEITLETVTRKASRVMEVSAKGATRIERSFYLIHLVDWASYYLSVSNNVDAMDISIIDYLKVELSKLN